MTTRFSSGELVRLKSGGPTMTVKGQDNYENVFCIWFDAINNVREASFKFDTLALHVSNGPVTIEYNTKGSLPLEYNSNIPVPRAKGSPAIPPTKPVPPPIRFGWGSK